MDKKIEGEGKQAALIAMGHSHFVKNVVVVDKDIDPFNEEEVMWCVATRVQADEDVDILENIRGCPLDPSLKGNIMTSKMVIDATKPIERPFPKRLEIPIESLNKVKPLLQGKGLI